MSTTFAKGVRAFRNSDLPVVMLVSLIMYCCVAPSYAADTIRLTNGEFPPYFSEQLRFNGFCSQIVTEAFALEGVQVIYGFYPWKRTYILSAKGDWDGSVGWRYSEERGKEHYFSDQPIWTGRAVFFHRKDYPFEWESLTDLNKVKIGVTLGYGYTQPFQTALDEGIISADSAAKDDLNFRKLLLGRIDIFPNDLLVGDYLLHTAFSQKERQQITHHPKDIGTIDYHVILSKKHKHNTRMMEIFNKGLQRLKTSGRYDQIVVESRPWIGISIEQDSEKD